jgi:hypothetical protein
MEYRYWSFIEAHPAHNSLPVNAKIEAMDVLTWAWTGESISAVVSMMMLIHVQIVCCPHIARFLRRSPRMNARSLCLCSVPSTMVR